MAGELGNYDINAVEVSFAGISIKDGLVSFEIAPEGDAYDDEVGADGRGCRWATGENRAMCNIVLKGYSAENAKLSAVHAADKAVTSGLGVAPFLLRDGNGASIVSTDQAYIKAMPSATFSNKREDVTWKIRLFLSAPLEHVIAGN